MKLKKLLTAVVVFFIVVSMNIIPAKAETVPTGGSTWNVLVLVLPDTAVSKFNNPRQVTTMHYKEIEQIKAMAKSINSWSNGQLRLNVDVKVDYEAVNRLTFGNALGWTLEPRNISSQIAKNSTMNQYDSILAVYRSADESCSVDLRTGMYISGRTKSANGASFVSLPLKDANHNLEEFNIVSPEQKLVAPLLESVYNDISKKHPEVKDPMFFNENAEKNVSDMKTYMFIGDKTTLTPYWDEFTTVK
ncbi:hypothetical protein [Clostridium cavendishii]|nr:hypothetical protein [Clostridium cavendishii]